MGLPRAGEPARLAFTKYDGSPHWWYDLTVVGVDAFGLWVGGGPESVCRRPGRTVTPGAHWVTVVPYDARYVATFNAPGGTLSASVYVDLISPPQWSRDETGALRILAVDLDLDVVRRFSGTCSLEDEDEFEAHRVRFGYPDDLVTATRAAALGLLRDVRDGREPYGRVGLAWLQGWQTGRIGPG